MGRKLCFEVSLSVDWVEFESYFEKGGRFLTFSGSLQAFGTTLMERMVCSVSRICTLCSELRLWGVGALFLVRKLSSSSESLTLVACDPPAS